MSENISNYVEGTINGRPIAGYHRVKYGETQEYLESLAEAGYMLMYSEDNPPEEGKLTVAKPNVMPEYLKDYATNVVYDEYGNFISCSVEGLITLAEDNTGTDTTHSLDICGPQPDFIYRIDPNFEDPHITITYCTDEEEAKTADTTVAQTTADLIAGLKSYLEEIAPKMSDIGSLTDEEVISFNATLKSYKEALQQADVFTYLAETTLDPRTDTGMNPETFDPRTDTSLNDLLDSYIAALDEKEAKTSDTTVTDTTTADTTDTEYYYGLDNWSVGENGELIYKDSTKYIKFTSTDLPFCLVSLDNRGRMMGDMDPPGQESTPPPVVTIEDLTPVLIPVSSELLQRFEEAKKLRQRLAERSNPIAFVSIMDAETEAVTSVQVACAEDDGWRTVGVLNNADGIDWKYQAGNLTGSGAASVVWHAQELGALGVWTDGTDNWTGIAGWFDANWTMLGCGDFDGDRKDSVLMSLNGGLFYSVDLDGTLTSLGDLNWSGWEFGAAGDFAGDGKDDIVLLHKELGCVVLLADGNADDYTALGQLDGSDWAIAGVRDFDGDGIDDLLVHQDSTGLIGGYAGADMSQWSVVGNAHYLYSDTAVLA